MNSTLTKLVQRNITTHGKSTIDRIMITMDKVHNTNFYAFVTDRNNRPYVLSKLKRISPCYSEELTRHIIIFLSSHWGIPFEELQADLLKDWKKEEQKALIDCIKDIR